MGTVLPGANVQRVALVGSDAADDTITWEQYAAGSDLPAAPAGKLNKIVYIQAEFDIDQDGNYTRKDIMRRYDVVNDE